MNNIKQLDQTYQFIMDVFVDRGQAPHFTEIARALSVPPEEGKRRLHALMNAELPLHIWIGIQKRNRRDSARESSSVKAKDYSFGFFHRLTDGREKPMLHVERMKISDALHVINED